jgi:hypothetical protein
VEKYHWGLRVIEEECGGWGKLILEEWEDDQILLEIVEKRKTCKNLEDLPEKSIPETLSNSQN